MRDEHDFALHKDEAGYPIMLCKICGIRYRDADSSCPCKEKEETVFNVNQETVTVEEESDDVIYVELGRVLNLLSRKGQQQRARSGGGTPEFDEARGYLQAIGDIQDLFSVAELFQESDDED